jgi:eukaryotic-like serine/threonine-protein kinase
VRDASFYASSLLDLDKIDTAAERRASWRQSMAALARATSEEGPGPLEGLHPKALVAGVRAALESGLVDDLDWLAPPAAGAALYELASALPPGPEQRELGRRVLPRLLAADAETFVAIARRMALAGRGLGSAAMRARVVLVTELPISMGVQDGSLALALASRRESAREWIGVPSTGSLPSRRLAARLIERAAREAALRSANGDNHSLRVFGTESVAGAWTRLLADRESLVWRHLAVARGMLAPWSPALTRGVEQALSPSLTPTEWRRAAASLAAMVAVAPERALELAEMALENGLLERDPGAATAFLWGLPRAAEMEPDAAQQLLELVLDRAAPDIGEGVLDLRAELGESVMAERASARAMALLSEQSKGRSDDGAAALALEVARDLGNTLREDDSTRTQIAKALREFGTGGAKQAYAIARHALSVARASVDALEAVSREEDAADSGAGSIARRTTVAVLRDLDLSLLEHDVLAHLLSLGDAPRNIEETLDGLRDRLGEWILVREGVPLVAPGPGAVVVPAHPTLALRRLRALLHLADGDIGDEGIDPVRATRLRRRCVRIANALLDRFERGPASPVRRTIVAALGRTLDALIRLGTIDAVDALLIVAAQMGDPTEIRTLAEASMDPDLVHALERYQVFAKAVVKDSAHALPAYDTLVGEFTLDDSSRSEALRAVLVRLGGALGAIGSASSLRGLASSATGELEVISTLETSLASLAQLAVGARGRLDPEGTHPGSVAASRPLTVAVARVLSGTDASLAEPAVVAALEILVAGVPKSVAWLASSTVLRIASLPKEGRVSDAPLSRVAEVLPAWLTPRRTIGGFYVLRSLNAGAAGSVFVATRIDEKNDEGAERYALKVPEYSATVARSLSEAEFMTMFRHEAAALLALPVHPNLARFVLFDDASKPKPILVMELVEGTPFDRLVEAGGLDTARVLAILDGVLNGLIAMHNVGVGHLDVKPSNVVLRRTGQPVLVDFGLAGRHVRPGCATGPYGAPEVWGALEGKEEASPAKADVYAFACVLFEALTGRLLFEAPSEMAQIAMHLAHDGLPEPLKALSAHPKLAVPALSGLSELLFAALRRNPRDRPTAAAVRKELARLTPALSKRPWPIDAR